MSTPPSLILSSLDVLRLEKLLQNAEWRHSPAAVALEAEIDRADIVDPQEIPAGVVTMNSRVRLLNISTGQEMSYTLVYPQDGGEGCLSVLAPVGSALLGLSVGQEIDWPLPSGNTHRIKVLDVLYQPEAAGEFTR
ncbi:nucleoside diphosphate kinase regulator [Aquaspirillum soli]|nr:nucleoside diphosphate kinase regulator [Aquaspirillum sp.]